MITSISTSILHLHLPPSRGQEKTSQSTPLLHSTNGKFVFYLLLTKIKFYQRLKSFTRFNIDQNNSNSGNKIPTNYELDIYERGWPWVKMQSRPNLAEGVLRGQKRKNCLFLSKSIQDLDLYKISKNQPSRSIRREDTRVLYTNLGEGVLRD